MGRNEPPEGLAWLGHQPARTVPSFFRIIAALAHFAAYRLGGLSLRIEGKEQRPEPPFIIACAMHRSWIDSLAIIEAFPFEPRIWYIASGTAAFRTPLRAGLVRGLGGVLPVYRGGYSIDSSVESARAVIRAGAVLGFFPEGSRKGPPDALQPFRGGIGYLALRSRARVVPVALAGTKELYIGKRVALRILPPIDPLAVAGLAAPPVEGSAEERDAAHRVTHGLRATLEPHVLELAAWTADPPGQPRRLRWLSHLFP